MATTRTHRRLSRPGGRPLRRGVRPPLPGRQAHPSPDLPRRGRGGRAGPRPLRRPPDRELARRPGRRDARSPLRVAALDRRGGDPAGQPLSRRARRPSSSAQIREIHSHPVALDQCRKLIASLPHVARSRSADDGRRRLDRRRPRRPDGRRDRERPRSPPQPAHDHRRQRRRPSRGVHAVRLDRPVHAPRPPRRRVAHGVLVHDRPPPRARSSMRSSRSPATASTSTSSSRGRFPRARSAIASTPSSAAIRSTRRSPPRFGRWRGLTTALRVFGSYLSDRGAGVGPRTV